MKIVDTELYSLIPVWMTLIFIQGDLFRKNENILTHFLAESLTGLDKIHYTVVMCWFSEAHTSLILHH